MLSHAGAEQYSTPLCRNVCSLLAQLYGYMNRYVMRDLGCQQSPRSYLYNIADCLLQGPHQHWSHQHRQSLVVGETARQHP